MSQHLTLSILRSRDFRFLLLTRVFTVMALQAQAVIVGWQIYVLTKDVFLLGLTGLAEAVPAISCALFAGHVVDISRPQRIFLAALGVLALNSFGLLMFAGGFIPVAGNHLLYFIYGGIFVSGVARSFLMPATFSLLAQIVMRKDIPAASAWLSTSVQIAFIIGPAAAGIIYGGYGERMAWVLPVCLSCMAFLMMAMIRPAHHTHNVDKRPSAIKSIKEGWVFILQHPALLSMMALDMFAVLFGGAMALLPAYADEVLHVGSEGLGILRGAPALGAVVTALFFAVCPMKEVSAKRLLLVVTGFGFSMIGFGLSKIFIVSVIFLMISGMFDSVSMIIRSTMMQLLTPDHMRGRVSSVNSMFIISSNEIGVFESGTLAKLVGLVPSVVLGGIATLLVVVITAVSSPKFRNTVVRADD